MNKITQAREQLVTDLQVIEDLKVHDSFPNKVEARSVVVQPAEAYITAGANFGSYQVNITVEIYTQRNKGLEALEELTSEVLENSMDWNLGPSTNLGYPSDRPDLLTITINLSKDV